MIDTKLRLYVWDEIFYRDGGGMAVAIAESADQARELVRQRFQFPENYPTTAWIRRELRDEPKVYDLDQPVAVAMLGYERPYEYEPGRDDRE